MLTIDSPDGSTPVPINSDGTVDVQITAHDGTREAVSVYVKIYPPGTTVPPMENDPDDGVTTYNPSGGELNFTIRVPGASVGSGNQVCAWAMFAPTQTDGPQEFTATSSSGGGPVFAGGESAKKVRGPIPGGPATTLFRAAPRFYRLSAERAAEPGHESPFILEYAESQSRPDESVWIAASAIE